MGWLGAWHRRSVDEQLHLPPSPSPADQPQAAPLTERELEVLARLAERLSNKEIAKQLFLSPLTVKRHTLNIYHKLGVHGRREAVDKATPLGILATTDRWRASRACRPATLYTLVATVLDHDGRPG